MRALVEGEQVLHPLSVGGEGGAVVEAVHGVVEGLVGLVEIGRHEVGVVLVGQRRAGVVLAHCFGRLPMRTWRITQAMTGEPIPDAPVNCFQFTISSAVTMAIYDPPMPAMCQRSQPAPLHLEERYPRRAQA